MVQKQTGSPGNGSGVMGAATIVKATMLLDLFTPERTAITLAELATELRIPKPTVHRLLAALKSRGYLRQDRSSGPYALGPRALGLAQAYRASNPLPRIAQPHMEALLREVHQTVALYVRNGDRERVCIERLTSAHPMQVVMAIGESTPLGVGAGGRVLALDDKAARSVKALVTYAERVPNACGIASPIFDHQGRVVAALDVSGPLDRFPKSSIAKFSRAVQRTALAISRGLGFSTTP